MKRFKSKFNKQIYSSLKRIDAFLFQQINDDVKKMEIRKKELTFQFKVSGFSELVMRVIMATEHIFEL